MIILRILSEYNGNIIAFYRNIMEITPHFIGF